jgi:hypothetical protein
MLTVAQQASGLKRTTIASGANSTEAVPIFAMVGMRLWKLCEQCMTPTAERVQQLEGGMAERSVQHEILPDGESTEQWACRMPGFFGSIHQLLHCARCGERLPPRRYDEPCHYRDVFKPTLHIICDECHDALPD